MSYVVVNIIVIYFFRYGFCKFKLDLFVYFYCYFLLCEWCDCGLINDMICW